MERGGAWFGAGYLLGGDLQSPEWQEDYSSPESLQGPQAEGWRNGIITAAPGGTVVPVTAGIEAGPLRGDTGGPTSSYLACRSPHSVILPTSHHGEMKAVLLFHHLLDLGNPVLAGGTPGCMGLASHDTRDPSILSGGLAESQAPASACWLLFVPLLGLLGGEWASSLCSSLALPVLISLQGPCSSEVTIWGDPRDHVFHCPRRSLLS